MIQTMTQGIIHFEDLDPRIFEKMCLDLLVASKEYKDFKTYGVKGNDDGQDIRCRVVDCNQTCFVQCKRWKSLCLSEMKGIVDRIVKDEDNYKSQIILIIAACDISKDVQDAYEAYASDDDSSHYEIAYDAWCKHLLPKGFVENFVAFRKAFTLAWSRSKFTNHDDPDFIKHYQELDIERFIRLTPKR